MATAHDAPYKQIQRQPPFNVRSVLEIVVAGRRMYRAGDDGVIRRSLPKVKGKAAAKRAKRARIRGRQSALKSAA